MSIPAAVLSPLMLFAILGFSVLEDAINNTDALIKLKKKIQLTIHDRWHNNEIVNKPNKVILYEAWLRFCKVETCLQRLMIKQQSHNHHGDNDGFLLSPEDLGQTGRVWMYSGSHVTRTRWTKPSRIKEISTIK